MSTVTTKNSAPSTGIVLKGAGHRLIETATVPVVPAIVGLLD